MEEKVSRRKSELSESQFLTSDNLALHELRNEQFRQVLRASLAIRTYALKDSLIRKLFFKMFSDQNYPAAVPNGARSLHLVPDSNSRGNAQIP